MIWTQVSWIVWGVVWDHPSSEVWKSLKKGFLPRMEISYGVIYFPYMAHQFYLQPLKFQKRSQVHGNSLWGKVAFVFTEEKLLFCSTDLFKTITWHWRKCINFKTWYLGCKVLVSLFPVAPYTYILAFCFDYTRVWNSIHKNLFSNPDASPTIQLKTR